MWKEIRCNEGGGVRKIYGLIREMNIKEMNIEINSRNIIENNHSKPIEGLSRQAETYS